MAILGDCMVGTVPPLSLRVYADPLKPREVDTNGKVHFTIGKASICADGVKIDDELEKKLAWFFILHGRWDKIDQPAKIINDQLDYTELSVSPIQWDKNQAFAMLGFLSEMISSHYNYLTSPEGKILRIIPDQQPNKLSVLIPHDYKGKVLKLWRFTLQANYDDIKEGEANIRMHEDRS